jgi:hypothetical protein
VTGTTLRRTMVEAWHQRGEDAADFLRHSQEAPALFKPEALVEAVDTVRHAMAAIQWWSAS